MTVSTQVSKRIYAANGATRTWDVDFPLANADGLQVIITSPQGTQTDVSAQSVLDASLQVLTYPTVESEQDPLPNGWTITLVRTTPPTQDIDLLRQGELDAEVLEKGYDKLTLLVQELKEQVARCVKFPVSSAQAASDAGNFIARVLTKQEAANTYLPYVQAAATYLPQADAASTYLTQAQASTTYLTKTDAAVSYLTPASAANTYLTQADAAQTYVTPADVASGLSTKQDTIEDLSAIRAGATAGATALQPESAASTYATQSALTTGLAGKQDALSTAQLTAINSGVTSSTVSQVQTNAQVIAALDDELDVARPWAKPADWMDIRSGALPNSVYFLVGHSADYQTYPKFGVFARTTSGTGTYDVYVDGIKQATTATNTNTVLDWATLALTSGRTVSYPSALTTHIVRITPTTSTDTLSICNVDATNITSKPMGVLWAHFSLTNAISLGRLFNRGNAEAPLVEAVTAANDTITLASGQYSVESLFRVCPSLQYMPLLDMSTVTGALEMSSSNDKDKFKRLRIKGLKETVQYGYTFRGLTGLEHLEADGCVVKVGPASFYNCKKLKKLNVALDWSGTTAVTSIFNNCVSLQETFLDTSAATGMTQLGLGGSSTSPLLGIKGVVVSPQAPFSGSSPQLNVSYTGLDRFALINLFNSMPTVSNSQVCNVTGATGAADLTAEDLAIATAKGWTVTR